MYDGMLRALVASVPGARGAVFCDPEGEAVSSVGASGRTSPESLDDFDLKVTGAQLATPLERVEQARDDLGALREMVVRGKKETLVVHSLKDGYYLVVCLAPSALASRALPASRKLASRLVADI